MFEFSRQNKWINFVKKNLLVTFEVLITFNFTWLTMNQTVFPIFFTSKTSNGISLFKFSRQNYFGRFQHLVTYKFIIYKLTFKIIGIKIRVGATAIAALISVNSAKKHKNTEITLGLWKPLTDLSAGLWT